MTNRKHDLSWTEPNLIAETFEDQCNIFADVCRAFADRHLGVSKIADKSLGDYLLYCQAPDFSYPNIYKQQVFRDFEIALEVFEDQRSQEIRSYDCVTEAQDMLLICAHGLASLWSDAAIAMISQPDALASET